MDEIVKQMKQQHQYLRIRIGQTHITRSYSALYNRSIDYIQTQNLIDKGHTINTLLSKDFLDNSLWKRIFNADESLIIS